MAGTSQREAETNIQAAVREILDRPTYDNWAAKLTTRLTWQIRFDRGSRSWLAEIPHRDATDLEREDLVVRILEGLVEQK